MKRTLSVLLATALAAGLTAAAFAEEPATGAKPAEPSSGQAAPEHAQKTTTAKKHHRRMKHARSAKAKSAKAAKTGSTEKAQETTPKPAQK